jgi:hypothetical protein
MNVKDIISFTVLTNKNSKGYIKVRNEVKNKDAKDVFPNRTQMRFTLV